MISVKKLTTALKKVDEVDILSLLNITTEEIIERFEDRIKERQSYLAKEMELGLDEKVEELNFE